jgi:hypothetical protein
VVNEAFGVRRPRRVPIVEVVRHLRMARAVRFDVIDLVFVVLDVAIGNVLRLGCQFGSKSAVLLFVTRFLPVPSGLIL